jgi:AbrB family looped-hinge helix DNA binding protein
MKKTIKVDRKNRILIPAAIRKRLGFTPGSVVRVEERADGFALKLVTKKSKD